MSMRTLGESYSVKGEGLLKIVYSGKEYVITLNEKGREQRWNVSFWEKMVAKGGVAEEKYTTKPTGTFKHYARLPKHGDVMKDIQTGELIGIEYPVGKDGSVIFSRNYPYREAEQIMSLTEFMEKYRFLTKEELYSPADKQDHMNTDLPNEKPKQTAEFIQEFREKHNIAQPHPVPGSDWVVKKEVEGTMLIIGKKITVSEPAYGGFVAYQYKGHTCLMKISQWHETMEPDLSELKQDAAADLTVKRESDPYKILMERIGLLEKRMTEMEAVQLRGW